MVQRLPACVLLSVSLHVLPMWALWPTLELQLTLGAPTVQTPPPQITRVKVVDPQPPASPLPSAVVRTTNATRSIAAAQAGVQARRSQLAAASSRRQQAAVAVARVAAALVRAKVAEADAHDAARTSAGQLRVVAEPLRVAEERRKQAERDKVRTAQEADNLEQRAVTFAAIAASDMATSADRVNANAQQARATAALSAARQAEVQFSSASAAEAVQREQLLPVQQVADEQARIAEAARALIEHLEGELMEADAEVRSAKVAEERASRNLIAANAAAKRQISVGVQLPRPQTFATASTTDVRETAGATVSESNGQTVESKAAAPKIAAVAKAATPRDTAVGETASASKAMGGPMPAASKTTAVSASAILTATADLKAVAPKTTAVADSTAVSGPVADSEAVLEAVSASKTAAPKATAVVDSTADSRPAAPKATAVVAAAAVDRTTPAPKAAAEKTARSSRGRPQAKPVAAVATGDGLGGGGQGFGAELQFVRTEGVEAATFDPLAQYIGVQSTVSAIYTRAATTTRAASGDRSVISLPDPEVSPEHTVDGAGNHAAGSKIASSDERSQPATSLKLPDLQSDGPAADGFVLSLLEESADDAPNRTRGIVTAPIQLKEPEVPAVQPSSNDGEYTDAADLFDAFEPTGALAVLPEEVERGVVTAMSVSAHPLAEWMGGIDDALRERWLYPPELRALGVEGTVELKFTVLPNGRVVDVRVVSAEGPADFTFAAMASVPKSVSPLPAGWGRLDIHYTFRYRAGSRLSPGR